MQLVSARIVIVERWSILRRGLIGILQTKHVVVDDFAEVAELVAVLRERKVDVAVIGDGPGFDVAAVVAHLRDVQPAVHLVVLCDHTDPEVLRAVLQAGAGAVLSKKAEGDALLDGIARVLDGERVVDQTFLPLLFGMEHPDRDGDEDAPSLLTRRERDVLLEVARGASNREIAQTLVMSESTVKSHLQRIYSKLEVNGRHGAIGRAMELDLLN